MITISLRTARNRAALWQWIKREVEADNVESVSLETVIEEVLTEERQPLLKSIRERKVTIVLAGD